MISDYPKLAEKLTRRRLENGLEIVVVHKPYHAKSYAVFATRYGGMDLRFSWAVAGYSCRDRPFPGAQDV